MCGPSIMVGNPARGQLNRKNEYFPVVPVRSRLRIWSPDTGSTVPSRVNLLILYSQAECGPYSRDSSRFPRRRPFIYTANCCREILSLSGHAIAYRWCSLPRVRRHRASSPHGDTEMIAVVVVVVVVFILKTVLTSIQYPSPSYSSRQRNEFTWSQANPKIRYRKITIK